MKQVGTIICTKSFEALKLTRYLIVIILFKLSGYCVGVLLLFDLFFKSYLLLILVHFLIVKTNVYEPFCTVITHYNLKNLSTTILTHILPWTKTGTEPALDVLTTRAKPLSNAGQFVHVTELNVPTVLTQQAQKIGVAAIKNYGKSNTCILSFNL
jgi:hypothetical protein